MIKADIVNEVEKAAEITKVEAEEAVDVLLAELKNGMVKGGRIELRGLGVFVVRPRKGGVGRNPRTGVMVPITPGRTVRFKPGKVVHESMAGGNSTQGQ